MSRVQLIRQHSTKLRSSFPIDGKIDVKTCISYFHIIHSKEYLYPLNIFHMMV